ncbi:MAG: Na/Pi cotransporter family protein [Alphaproteobacteria bacterium]
MFSDASYALISVIGGVALLLWGLRMIKTSATRGLGPDLKRLLGRMAGNRFTAIFAGMAGAIVMQSSTATILLASGFVANGFMALIPGLAVALGADVGSAIAAQVLTLDLKAFAPILALCGLLVFNMFDGGRAQNIGRGLMGLAIVFIALGQIVSGSQPMRDSVTLQIVFQAMEDELLLALVVGALVTFISHSSLATVLLIVSLVEAGTVSLGLGLKLVLGANLGAALPALVNSSNLEIEGRRVAIGNMMFRLIGVVLAAGFIPLAETYVPQLQLGPSRAVILGHLVFNTALLLVMLPLLGPMSRIIIRLTNLRPRMGEDAFSRDRSRLLDPAALQSNNPFRAIENARRQAIGMADLVTEMVKMAGKCLGPKAAVNEIRGIQALDDEVDDLNNAIKLYITEIRRNPLTHSDSHRLMTTFSFVTNMEHIGDIIDRNILVQAKRKIEEGVHFSKEGELEIMAMHDKMCANLELCISAFMSDDEELAQELIAKKKKFRRKEAKAMTQHLDRLQEGVEASLETSSIHMDLLRDFRRINSHITAVAYAIVDSTSVLPVTQIKKDKTDEEIEAEEAKPHPKPANMA